MISHDVLTTLYTYNAWLEEARLKNVHSNLTLCTPCIVHASNYINQKMHMKRLTSYIKFFNEF